MDDWNDLFDCVLSNPEQVKHCIFAPDSQAEILHWFSRDDIPKQRKEDFIRVLVNFNDECGDFYRYRAYFLAAEALNYFPESSFGDAIVKQLLDWSYVYFGWQLFPKPLVKAARNTLKVTDKTRVIKAFELLLRNTPSRLTLQSAAVKLGELDSGNKMAIAALILLLDATTDNYKLSSLCKSIAKIGAGNQAAINAVIELMETTEDKNLCCKAIRTLGKIGRGNQTATLALEKFLQINRGDRICLSAAEALLLIDSGNVVARDALVFLLENTEEMYLLVKAVKFLQEIDSQNQAAIKVLSERFKNCKDDVLRAEIAASLGRFDRNHPGVKETLIEILETSRSHHLFTFVEENIDDEEQNFHHRIIKNLVKIYPGDKEVISGLISFIEQDSNVNLFYSESLFIMTCDIAIDAIRNMSFGKHINSDIYQQILAVHIKFVKKYKDKIPEIDITVAEAMLQLELDNETAVSVLVETIETSQYTWIINKAAVIALQLYSHYQIAIQILVTLYSFEDLGVLLEYKRLFSENDLNKIVYKDKTIRLLIDDAISLEIKRLLNEIEKDKKLCQNSSYIPDKYFYFKGENFWCIWRNVDSINKKGYFPKIITALKEYLSEQFYNSTSSRYDEVYQLLWDYSKNMNYQDFHKAWNS